MKNWNFVCTCVAIAVYVILITLFFSFEKRTTFSDERREKFENCSYYNTCLTFCEEANYEKFTDDFIHEKFPYKDFDIRDYKKDQNKTVNFRVVKVKFECENKEEKKIISDHSNWYMFPVSIL
jgi:hypothetical protein